MARIESCVMLQYLASGDGIFDLAKEMYDNHMVPYPHHMTTYYPESGGEREYQSQLKALRQSEDVILGILQNQVFDPLNPNPKIRSLLQKLQTDRDRDEDRVLALDMILWPSGKEYDWRTYKLQAPTSIITSTTLEQLNQPIGAPGGGYGSQ